MSTTKFAVALGILCSAILPARLVSASWPTAATGTGRSRATALPAGRPPVATVAPANGRTVALTWPPASGGLPVSGYVVRSFNVATGVERAVGAACSGVIATTSCAEAAVLDGTWTYTTTPANGLWRGAQSARGNAVVVDATGPSTAVTFPAAGATYGPATWNAGCASGICGTANDAGSGVAAVTVSIRQGSGNYWNGTAFASAGEVLLPANGTTSWALPFPAANLTASGSYTVRAVAVDGTGNSTSSSVTATYDSVAPAPTGLAFQNGGTAGYIGAGDAIEVTFSEALAPSSVCSTWTGTGNQTLSNVTVTLSHPLLTVNDVFTFASSSCDLHIGTITSPSSYGSLVTVTLAPSTLTYQASTRTLRVVLGPLSGGLPLLPVAAVAASYTADAAITDIAQNPASTTVLTVPNQRF